MTTWTKPKLERLDIATLTQSRERESGRGNGRDSREDRHSNSWGHGKKKSCTRDDS